MFRRNSILTWLFGFAFFAGICWVVATLINLSMLRDSMLDERKSRLVSIIEKTEAIFITYDTYQRNGSMTLKQAQAQALIEIQALDDNYIFVFNDNYKLLATFEGTEAINSNVKYLTDPTGSYTYQWLHEQVQLTPAGSFISYYYPEFEGGIAKRKISYIRYFPAWGWTYGLGIYVDDIDNVISKTLGSFNELVI